MLKTILTLGPATESNESITSLLKVADRFRLNSSHMNYDDLNVWLQRLNNIFDYVGHEIPVVVDLQGSKMRIGKYNASSSIPDKVILTLGTDSSSSSEIPVPHEVLFRVLNSGDIIYLNDAKIILRVDTVEVGRVRATTLQNGPLSSNKGLNRKNHPVPFHKLTEKDLSMIEQSKKYSFVEYAFSFVHDGTEIDKIRPFIDNHKIIAKIERTEAVDNIEAIDKKFDEIWLCRGDLGAQAGIFKLGYLQDVFVSKIKNLKNECFLAGQVLEHMTKFPEPTRSEIVHLYDTGKNGFKGIVLSDETAIGENISSVANFLKNYNLNIRTQI